MKLIEIRNYINNIVDYAPDVESYDEQLNSIINDCYGRLFAEKPFTFASKEVVIKARADVSITKLVATNGSTAITTVDNLFNDTMAGQIIAIHDVEYTIAYVATAGSAIITEPYIAATSTSTATVRYRYLDCPADTISILQVIKRTMQLTPQEPGRMIPLTRMEDEYYNLPLNEVNLPNYWVPYDDFTVNPPRYPIAAPVASAAGQGERTVDVAMTYVYAGRESALSKSVTLELADNQQCQVTFADITFMSGMRRRIYARNKIAGWDAFRLMKTVVGSKTEIDPAPAVTETYAMNDFDASFEFQSVRHDSSDGLTQRFRLYPRQSEDTDITVRYMYNPPALIEDNDTPEFPAAHHAILAYMALHEIYIKLDNIPQANIYQRKAAQEMLKMEQRYLTQVPRRWIKRGMRDGTEDPLPIYSPLMNTNQYP